MKRISIHIAIICSLVSVMFSSQSCQEDININLNDQKLKRLVVEGSVTDENKPHQVRLTYTTSYFEDQLVPPVLNAQVTIEEKGTGINYPLALVDTTYGYYESKSFAGKVGETYILHITDGDNTYEAASKLDHVAQMDSINYKYKYFPRDSRGYYIIRMSAYEPDPVGDIYMFYLYVNDTLYNKKLSSTPSQDDLLYNNKYLANVEIFYLPQEEIIQKTNKIRLVMLSITEEEYKYNNAFINETYNSGSIFSGPPANIPSNVLNISGGPDGVGFFGASAISVGKTMLTKEHDDSTNDPEYTRSL